MRRILLLSLAAALLVVFTTSCVPQQRRYGYYHHNTISGRNVGAVLGGVTGGLVGAQFGKGSGKTAATIAGVLIGASIGSQVGAQYDSYDQGYMYRALENNTAGRPVYWYNSHHHHTRYSRQRNAFTPYRPYYNSNGRLCRDYTRTVYINGVPQNSQGTACRDLYGRWRMN